MADQMVSDPYAHLRASASERAKHTVARTENGIRAIRARGETVTARSLERETGLTFKSIQRNVGAYELYKGAAKEIIGGSKRRARRPRHTRQDGSEFPMRDSLMAYKKPQLVVRLRTAIRRVEELETAVAVQAGICQERHIRTIMSLSSDLARLQNSGNAGDSWNREGADSGA
jgi:hypothetical protein